MPAKQFAGVDGCRAGWLAAVTSGRSTYIALYSSVRDLLEALPGHVVLIDMPVGLPREPRRLEGLARQNMFGQKSSVFSVPCRQAVNAKSYERAQALNRRHYGKGISKQSFYICPKIREVDRELRRRIEAGEDVAASIFESHPELSFQQLAGGVLPSKKSAEGGQVRVEILQRLLPGVDKAIEKARDLYPVSAVAHDDILDALVLLAVARGKTKVLQHADDVDPHGLPIRMLVPAP